MQYENIHIPMSAAGACPRILWHADWRSQGFNHQPAQLNDLLYLLSHSPQEVERKKKKLTETWRISKSEHKGQRNKGVKRKLRKQEMKIQSFKTTFMASHKPMEQNFCNIKAIIMRHLLSFRKLFSESALFIDLQFQPSYEFSLEKQSVHYLFISLPKLLMLENPGKENLKR